MKIQNAQCNLCKDNLMCCDDDCKRCANRIYKTYIHCKQELEMTRKFILTNDLAFALNNFAKEYRKYRKD